VEIERKARARSISTTYIVKKGKCKTG